MTLPSHVALVKITSFFLDISSGVLGAALLLCLCSCMYDTQLVYVNRHIRYILNCVDAAQCVSIWVMISNFLFLLWTVLTNS